MTFTQMNLELTGCNPGQPNGGCPPGGCDFVSVFDGQGADAPLIGKYSGALSGAALPSVVSSGEWIRIEFHTDGRNCGITNGEDPVRRRACLTVPCWWCLPGGDHTRTISLEHAYARTRTQA